MTVAAPSTRVAGLVAPTGGVVLHVFGADCAVDGRAGWLARLIDLQFLAACGWLSASGPGSNPLIIRSWAGVNRPAW